MKPDVIVVNPSSMDYPLWRHTVEQVRDQLGKIIVVHYPDHKGRVYTDFVIRAMKHLDVTHIHIGNEPGDWRNNAIRNALSKTGELVLFTEQDFIPKDPVAFFQHTIELFEGNRAGNLGLDVLGFSDGGEPAIGRRLHPAFLMARWDSIAKTAMDFSARPDIGLDHFGMFSNELILGNDQIRTLESVGLYPDIHWKHWAGVTHNYNLVMAGQKPCYKLDEFKQYVEMAIATPVLQQIGFVELCEKCIAECG